MESGDRVKAYREFYKSSKQKQVALASLPFSYSCLQEREKGHEGGAENRDSKCVHKV